MFTHTHTQPTVNTSFFTMASHHWSQMVFVLLSKCVQTYIEISHAIQGITTTNNHNNWTKANKLDAGIPEKKIKVVAFNQITDC